VTKKGGGSGSIDLKLTVTRSYLKRSHGDALEMIRDILESPELSKPRLTKVFEAPAYCAADLLDCQARTAGLVKKAEKIISNMEKNANPFASNAKDIFSNLKGLLSRSNLGLRQRRRV
jgi:hypothetical protein